MPATNPFPGRVADPAFPNVWVAHTAADTDTTYVFNHVRCTVAGNVVLRNYFTQTLVTMPIAVGETITGWFDRVNAASTATGIFIGYCLPQG